MNTNDGYSKIEMSDKSLKNFYGSIKNFDPNKIDKSYNVNVEFNKDFSNNGFVHDIQPANLNFSKELKSDSLPEQEKLKEISNDELINEGPKNESLTSDSLENIIKKISSMAKSIPNQNAIQENVSNNAEQPTNQDKNKNTKNHNKNDAQLENEKQKNTDFSLSDVIARYIPEEKNNKAKNNNKKVQQVSSKLPSIGTFGIGKTYNFAVSAKKSYRISKLEKGISLLEKTHLNSYSIIDNLAKSQYKSPDMILKAEKDFIDHCQNIKDTMKFINKNMKSVNFSEFYKNAKLRNSGSLEQLEKTINDVNATFNKDLVLNLNESGNESIVNIVENIGLDSNKIKDTVKNITTMIVNALGNDRK